VDLEIAREVFHEAAKPLHDGLAPDGLGPDGLGPDGLDGHDADAAVAGWCVDLVADDPRAAVGTLPPHRCGLLEICTTQRPSAVYLIAAAILQR